jgi:hypothetical protein
VAQGGGENCAVHTRAKEELKTIRKLTEKSSKQYKRRQSFIKDSLIKKIFDSVEINIT